MTQPTSESMISERKNKFKYSNNRITVKLNLIYENGTWREVSEEMKNWTCIDNTVMYKKENGNDIEVLDEQIEYIKPYWDLANYVESKATYSGSFDVVKFRVDPMILSRLQLVYYLKSCSLIDLKLEKDPQGFEYISNIQELMGENGLHPSIVNILVERIRS